MYSIRSEYHLQRYPKNNRKTIDINLIYPFTLTAGLGRLAAFFGSFFGVDTGSFLA